MQESDTAKRRHCRRIQLPYGHPKMLHVGLDSPLTSTGMAHGAQRGHAQAPSGLRVLLLG